VLAARRQVDVASIPTRSRKRVASSETAAWEGEAPAEPTLLKRQLVRAVPDGRVGRFAKGAVEVTVAGVKHRVSATEPIVLPPNVPHAVPPQGIEALEATTDLEFFSSPRADWKRGDEGYLHRSGNEP